MELVGLGFRGLSCFGPENQYSGVPGLSVANTHIDPVDWHGTRSLTNPKVLMDSIVKIVTGESDGPGGRVLGLLTHHLMHDEALWHFIEGFCQTVDASPGASWCDPATLFQ